MECICLKGAQYLSDYKIHLTFNTGEEGVIDLKELIYSSPAAQPLQDKEEFAKFYLDEWPTLAWKCGFDVAPESLYEHAEKHAPIELIAQEESEDYKTLKNQSLHKFSYNDIESAFFYVNSGGFGENRALICKDIGKILWESNFGDEHEIEEAEEDGTLDLQYCVEMPPKNDLNLGQKLIFEFINKELPNEYDRVSDIFRRKGAYSRYKDFLERCGKLDEWHAFEKTREKKALLEWCKAEGIQVDG